jgi:hypothetical protein
MGFPARARGRVKARRWAIFAALEVSTKKYGRAACFRYEAPSAPQQLRLTQIVQVTSNSQTFYLREVAVAVAGFWSPNETHTFGLDCD